MEDCPAPENFLKAGYAKVNSLVEAWNPWFKKLHRILFNCSVLGCHWCKE